MSASKPARTAQTRYDRAERERALALADEHGPEEAARRTGIASGTIRRWRSQTGRVSAPHGVDPDAWAERKRIAAEETWSAARDALGRVRELLARGDGRSERDAKDAALTLAILLDKSAALEEASARAAERKAKAEAEQVASIANALVAVFEDLRLPRLDLLRDVVAHHLRRLEDPDAPSGPSPVAAAARDALRDEVRAEVQEQLRREAEANRRAEEARQAEEEERPAPIAALPAGDPVGEPASEEVVDGEVVPDSFVSEGDENPRPERARRRRPHGVWY